jgi:N-methylhydantoinase A
MLLGVDVGGTFTDAALIAGDRLVTAKAPSTPDDQSHGVLDAVRAALETAGAEAGAVERFVHGMTVGTNALLEGKVARTALLATEGFTDLEELGRQARAELYRLCAGHPPPLVPPELRIAVPERTGPDGVLRELDADALAERLGDLDDVESAAVCLLWGFRHPGHERRAAELVEERLSGVHVSTSHDTAGVFREYERCATTVVDAALSPLLRRYLERLAGRAREAGLPVPEVMLSGGGVAAAEMAARHGSWTVLSGPAGGAVGAALLAARAGAPDAVCLDMGGTSCDVSVARGGRIGESGGREVGGRALALPMVDVHTVGAGGGSVAWRDAGGALRVGPRSAGADPGPACYGRGGEEPTVTDANLLLGYLSSDAPLAGSIELRRDLAEEAVGRLARDLGLDLLECAEGIRRVANSEMVRALRVMTVERGVDPRGLALLAFGGAGPLHAAAIADELEMDTILCPRASGVLAALGLVVSERRRDAQRSVLLAGEEMTAEAISTSIGELARRARADLDDATLRVTCELRYRGQAFELAVETGESPDPDALREAFAAAHEEAYGYRDPEGVVELVNVRVTATEPGQTIDAATAGAAASGARQTRRRAIFAGEEREADVLTGEPEPGVTLTGPAICELPESTIVVPPGWAGRVEDSGTVRLERA